LIESSDNPGMWKDPAVAYFKIPSRHKPGGQKRKARISFMLFGVPAEVRIQARLLGDSM
jgi:hypothetical protein